MSETATWSTHTTPLARVAGGVVLTLGCFSIVFSAITLALGGRAWTLPAWLCLVLVCCLVFLRLRHERRSAVRVLSYHPESGGFQIAGLEGCLELVRVWQGPGWVTLGLRQQGAARQVLYLVLWKSAIPTPFWSELALRFEADAFRGEGRQPRGKRHQNKENP